MSPEESLRIQLDLMQEQRDEAFANAEEYLDILAELRDILLGNDQESATFKFWLLPTVSSPGEIPGLAKERMAQLTRCQEESVIGAAAIDALSESVVPAGTIEPLLAMLNEHHVPTADHETATAALANHLASKPEKD